MKKTILLAVTVGVLFVAGCSSTLRTLKYADGRTTMTEERGGKVIGTWELKQVLSVEEKKSLRRGGWKYEGVVHSASGPDTFLLKRRINLPTLAYVAAARPVFHPTLITAFGTNTSSDGTWRIGVSETSLELSRLSGIGEADASPIAISSTTSPGEWKARAGWFVFIESISNVWAYDGGDRLVLEVEKMDGKGLAGVLYANGYPCTVPDEVLSRLSEPAKKRIRTN